MIKIYTDGASHHKSELPGGWAAVFKYTNKRKQKVVKILFGYDESTSNNRMELTAAYKALRYVTKHFGKNKRVKIITDSQILQLGITKWSKKWQRNGWVASDGSPVKNKDLWLSILKYTKKHRVTWKHVKGHSGNYWNEQADQWAVRAKEQGISGIKHEELVDADLRI